MNTTAARLIARGEERPLQLDDVEALLESKALVVDACRHVVRDAGRVVSLATRPVLGNSASGARVHVRIPKMNRFGRSAAMGTARRNRFQDLLSPKRVLNGRGR